MRSKTISDGTQKTYALVFDTGDEVMDELERFARTTGLTAAQITGIGAFRDVVLGYFDLDAKDYRRIPIAEQVEVVSLIGDVACHGDEPKLHLHVVVAKRDGSAWGGHLMSAHVRPTLELIVTESPAHLRRRTDPATGLALIEV